MTISREIVRAGDHAPRIEKSYARIAHVLDMPNLVQVQLDSFRWFQREGLRELFDEISPVQDFTGTRMELRFGDYEFGEPKYSELECRERDVTFAAPLRVWVSLTVKETGEVKEQLLFMGDFPLMTDQERSSSTAPSALSYRSWCARPASISHWTATLAAAATSAPPSSSRIGEPGSSSR